MRQEEGQEFRQITVARRLCLNAYTVRRWIHDGTLEAETIWHGRRSRYRIKKEVIDVLELPAAAVSSAGSPREPLGPRITSQGSAV